MAQSNRDERLTAELESLRALKKVSSIFDFEYTGEPPDRYTVIFRGKGICRDPSPQSEVKILEIHRCDLRLPYSYPERPPDVRWLSSLFHPNVSFSGFLNLRDVGLIWEKDMGLDIVCERLWDVARLAHLDLPNSSNHSARAWFEKGHDLTLPLDARPLRDKDIPSGKNIIRYRRRGQPDTKAPPADTQRSVQERAPTVEQPIAFHQQPARGPLYEAEPEILFIGEEAPPPLRGGQVHRATPVRGVSSAAPPIRLPQQDGDDDILYIE